MSVEARILIVDDEKSVRDVVAASLRRIGYGEPVQADCVAEARERLQTSGPFDLVILDIRMPGEDGLSLLRDLVRLAPQTVVIMASGLRDLDTAVDVLKAGAYDYLLKPLSPDVVQHAVARALRKRRLEIMALEHRENLERSVSENREALEATRQALLIGLCQMVEFRHKETGAHLQRMPEYVHVLTLDMAQNSPYADRIDGEFVASIVASAPLHDIGKVAVPDLILLKPGKLTPDEFEQVKRHTVWGRDICLNVKASLGTASSSFADMAIEVTYGHHERWDGTGYPEGRAGSHIPLSSRIVHVADFFDACRSSRVYRPEPIPLDTVIEMISEGAGSDFDPHVVESFHRTLDQFVAIEQKHTR